MRCRLASDDDVPIIRDLRRAWTDEEAGSPVDDPGFDAAFVDWWADQRAQRRHWIAFEDRFPAGMASVVHIRPMPRPGDDVRPWGYVHHVYVRPEHRERGIGTALLLAVVEACRHDRYRQLLLNPRPRSVPFYERAGFVLTGDLMRMGLA